jgi:GT2 family glycosyltransferase
MNNAEPGRTTLSKTMSVTPLRTLPECLSAPTPIAVRAIDVEGPFEELQLPPSASGAPYRTLLGLVRRGGLPLGWATLEVSTAGRVEVDEIASTVGDAENAYSISHLGPATTREHRHPGSSEDLLSVVVSTCADVFSTLRCIEAIRQGDTGPCEIVIVENRPTGSTVRRALNDRFGADESIRYVEETRPGLSSARNAGLRVARGDLIAFTDDDVIVDPQWARSLRRAFALGHEVECVTGLILPLEFETPTQHLVEQFASYAKGFVPRVYALDRPPSDQPLFPYAAGHFGSGANLAFRTGALRDLGGFDPVLGTGTAARGGEDLDIFIRVLQSRSLLAYEPRAMVWHRHPDTEAKLRRRAFDYGAALGAVLTKQFARGPSRLRILSLAPRGARYFLSPGSRKNAGRDRGFPRALVALELAGVLYGPIAYVVSLARARR